MRDSLDNQSAELSCHYYFYSYLRPYLLIHSLI